MHFYVGPHHLNSTGHHSYAFLRGVHSHGRHFYAFLREARSCKFPWGPFVCIFTCQPASPASQPSQAAYPASEIRQPASPDSQSSQPTQPAQPGNPASQLTNSPSQPTFVCIFTWCTLAWAPLGTICTWGSIIVHFVCVLRSTVSLGGVSVCTLYVFYVAL